MAVGTTGESPTLSHQEHKEVVEAIIKFSGKRIPIIAGAGSNSTAESIELMEFSEKVGADAALVVTPYYNKPNQKGLLNHYTILHDNSNLPIIIYNIPGRSIIDMNPILWVNYLNYHELLGLKMQLVMSLGFLIPENVWNGFSPIIWRRCHRARV